MSLLTVIDQKNDSLQELTIPLSADPNDRYPSIREMGRAMLELAAERTQMVWGHSFRPSLSDPLSSISR